MRNASRRSFTVEVKSDRRRPTTFIPPRVAQNAPPRRLTPEPVPEAKAPIVEKRRILPALPPPDARPAEAEPAPIVEERMPSRPRGRPRKPRPAVVEPVAASAEAPAPAPAAVPHRSVEAPGTARPETQARARKIVPATDLPRGERWKRRLGRWSR